MPIFVGLLLLLSTAIPSLANDGNAAITPKGIVFKEEKGILLEQEKLLITPSLIQVEYKFTNTTPNDIETDVAFPIPQYGSESLSSIGGIPEFSDFTVEIDNSAVKPQKIIKALVNGKDYAEKLRTKGISITNFEKITYGALDENLDLFRKKVGKDLQQFQMLGIVDKDGFPQWTVSLTYFWHMRFPAGKSTFVKHIYRPYAGKSYNHYAGFFDQFILCFGVGPS